MHLSTAATLTWLLAEAIHKSRVRRLALNWSLGWDLGWGGGWGLGWSLGWGLGLGGLGLDGVVNQVSSSIGGLVLLSLHVLVQAVVVRSQS